jgi:hypothetical protein
MHMTNKSPEKHRMENSYGLERKVGSVLILFSVQLTALLLFATLFLVSFLLSPLQPIFWMQATAVSILILGGFFAVGWVAWRHRPAMEKLVTKFGK